MSVIEKIHAKQLAMDVFANEDERVSGIAKYAGMGCGNSCSEA